MTDSTQAFYGEIASTLDALKRMLTRSPASEWVDRHRAHLKRLIQALPHGSGLGEPELVQDLSTETKLVLDTEILDEYGNIELPVRVVVTPGWTAVDVHVRPVGRRGRFSDEDLWSIVGEAFSYIPEASAQAARKDSSQGESLYRRRRG